MPTKRLLDARRSRKALPRGFGWIDHRLLRDGYLGQCRPEALALYVLLVCAADGQGLQLLLRRAHRSSAGFGAAGPFASPPAN